MSIFDEGVLAGVSRVAAQEAMEAREQLDAAQVDEQAADSSHAVVHEVQFEQTDMEQQSREQRRLHEGLEKVQVAEQSAVRIGDLLWRVRDLAFKVSVEGNDSASKDLVAELEQVEEEIRQVSQQSAWFAPEFAAEVSRARLSPRDRVDSSNPFEREAQRVRHLRRLVRTGQASPDELTHYLEVGVDEMEALARRLGRKQREMGDRLAPASSGPQATQDNLMGVVRSVAQELHETQNGLADAHGKQLSANALSLLGSSKDR